MLKLSLGHTGLGWALNSMTGVFIREMRERLGHKNPEEIQGRTSCENEDREQSDASNML